MKLFVVEILNIRTSVWVPLINVPELFIHCGGKDGCQVDVKRAHGRKRSLECKREGMKISGDEDNGENTPLKARIGGLSNVFVKHKRCDSLISF